MEWLEYLLWHLRRHTWACILNGKLDSCGCLAHMHDDVFSVRVMYCIVQRLDQHAQQEYSVCQYLDAISQFCLKLYVRAWEVSDDMVDYLF